MSNIILFDGVCNLCNNFVNWVIDHDPQGNFKFAPLQSETGRSLLQQFQLPADFDRIVFIQSDRCFTHSTAVLEILKKLEGSWSSLYALIAVPEFMRDVVYNWIADRRYNLMGKTESCRIPTPELQHRFLS